MFAITLMKNKISSKALSMVGNRKRHKKAFPSKYTPFDAIIKKESKPSKMNLEFFDILTQTSAAWGVLT